MILKLLKTLVFNNKNTKRSPSATGETIATYAAVGDDQALQAVRDSHEAFLK
nr:hypothetical protein [uncultured Halomonas sp.]